MRSARAGVGDEHAQSAIWNSMSVPRASEPIHVINSTGRRAAGSRDVADHPEVSTRARLIVRDRLTSMRTPITNTWEWTVSSDASRLRSENVRV